MRQLLPLILLILAAAIVSAQFPSEQLPISWQSVVQFQCQTSPCIENMPIIWQLTIGNPNNESFIVDMASVKTIDSITIASTDISKDTVPSLETKTFQLESIAPPPTKSSTLYYMACFTISGQETCESRLRTMVVYPLTEAECLDDIICNYNEHCFNFKCKPLGCNEAYNHTCVESRAISTQNLIFPLLIFVIILLLILIYFSLRKHDKKHTKTLKY